MPERRVLGIDSNYDGIIGPIFEHRQMYVYPQIQKNGFGLKKLQVSLARRQYVAQEAPNPSVKYITGVGHGAYSAYRGDQGELIFYINPATLVRNYGPEEVTGKIVHFVSCGTARNLGVDFVQNGCLAYFGYDDDYAWYPTWCHAFFECDSEIDRAFAENKTAAEVYQRVKQLHHIWIDRLRVIATLESDNALGTLKRNLRRLRSPISGGPMWGRPDAKLT